MRKVNVRKYYNALTRKYVKTDTYKYWHRRNKCILRKFMCGFGDQDVGRKFPLNLPFVDLNAPTAARKGKYFSGAYKMRGENKSAS